MKKNKILKIRLSEDVAKKLAAISKNEKMSVQNEITAMIRQKISYYERVKGNIKSEELQGISLDEFSDEE